MNRLLQISAFLFIGIISLQAQDTKLSGNLIEKTFGDRPEVYFEFSVNDRTDLDFLTRMISIDDVDPSGNVKAYANKKEFKDFLALGREYKILTPPSMLRKNIVMKDIAGIREANDWDYYPTYDAYVDMMYQFAEDFPDICQVFNFGYSMEERELLVARISDNVGAAENEPQFLYTSSMHGDETAGYVMMLRLIDHLLNNYGTDPRITNLVDETDIWINPLANPDGSFYAGNQNIYGAIRGNANGVDLNRNFPDPEDGPHPDGNPWQVETLAFMQLAEDNHFVMSCNIHGGAEVCNYPWDTWSHLTADDDWWVYVCREFADTVHAHSPSSYMNGFNNGITNGYAWYTISGGRQDYMTYFHQGREFTLEMSDYKLLPASQLPAHWEYTYRSFLNYIEQVLFGIRGKITDSANGNPLKAEVRILDHEEDSSWVYSHLPVGNYNRVIHEGTYDVKFSAPWYKPQTIEDVQVTNRETIVLDIELVHQFTGIEEVSKEGLKIYPNPVSGNYLQINSEDGIYELAIYNISGSVVSIEAYNGEKRVFTDVSSLPDGTYILSAQTGNNLLSGKFKVIH